MPFAAILGAGALNAGGSLLSGILGSNASSKAAGQEIAAANQAIGYEEGNYNTAQTNLDPFIKGGQNALTALQAMLGIGGGGQGGAYNPVLAMLGIGPTGQPTGSGINTSSFVASPGYQFQLQQGENAVTNSAAANGGLGGNALKALTNYGSGLANQSWQQYLGNVNSGWNSLTGELGSLAGSGQQAATNLGQIGTSVGSSVAGLMTGAGNAAAAGTIGSTNALTGGINGLINGLTTNSLSGSNGGNNNGNAVGALFNLLQGGGGGTNFQANGWNNPTNWPS